MEMRPCHGEFLCERRGLDDTVYHPIPTCDDYDGFCAPDGYTATFAYDLLWCDGEVVHLFHDTLTEP